ncbi:MAG: nucleotidyltransferase family protein [Magnetococcales bacterium]|nr:nucleotidyltransferase family protein [Magnetococcales bacterium]
MKAMILAAGRGTRLKLYTDRMPKPLVPVRGRPVIEYTLEQIAALGMHEVVINVWHLAEMLIDHIGDGARWGLNVTWSREETLMETGGGVRFALPLLGDQPVLIINGDILWRLELTPLLTSFDPARMDALLALITPPAPGLGDFTLGADGRLTRDRGAAAALTYAGIQILQPQVLADYPPEPFSLNRLYDASIAAGRLFGMHLAGAWADIGTPERLAQAEMTWPHTGHNA